MYLSKIPSLLQCCFPKYLWKVNTDAKKIYLTFDDGPVAGITEFVLAELEKYQAKATFFMLGKQVKKHPDLAKKVLAAGHSIGNHSYSHKNGWQTEDSIYLQDAQKGQDILTKTLSFSPSLFRPPYGKIKSSQANALLASHQIIMLDILCGDFDATRSPEKCAEIIEKYAEKGSIIVFHDSEKAFNNMKYALPRVLESFAQRGFSFEKL
ncbi:MAG: polysaccharide deacetylase family protein [Bacteroidia bacterium]